MCLNIVSPRRWLQTVAETCSNAFVSYTLVLLADNKCVHTCHQHEAVNYFVLGQSLHGEVFLISYIGFEICLNELQGFPKLRNILIRTDKH